MAAYAPLARASTSARSVAVCEALATGSRSTSSSVVAQRSSAASANAGSSSRSMGGCRPGPKARKST
jgi:hypothetical protein